MERHGRLPHLRPFEEHPIVYLTVVSTFRRPVLAAQDPFDVLTTLWRDSAKIDRWFVGDYLLMPDHGHLFAQPGVDARRFSEWVKSWKSQSARRLAGLCLHGRLWQEDYFDRFIRSEQDYAQKWDYILHNPVKAGLCSSPEQWPWRGRLHDLYYRSV